MENINTQFLPTVVTNNWFPISTGTDMYYNKLAKENVRDRIVKVTNPNKLKILK